MNQKEIRKLNNSQVVKMVEDSMMKAKFRGLFEVSTVYEEIDENDRYMETMVRVESNEGISVGQINALNKMGLEFQWMSGGIQKQFIIVFKLTGVQLI